MSFFGRKISRKVFFVSFGEGNERERNEREMRERET